MVKKDPKGLGTFLFGKALPPLSAFEKEDLFGLGSSRIGDPMGLGTFLFGEVLPPLSAFEKEDLSGLGSFRIGGMVPTGCDRKTGPSQICKYGPFPIGTLQDWRKGIFRIGNTPGW